MAVILASTLIITSLIAKSPTITLMKSIPARSFGNPKVSRAAPVRGSWPINAVMRPRAMEMIPFRRARPERLMIRVIAMNIKAKYSGGPNATATSARSGAKKVRPTRPSVPATKEEMAQMARAGPALAICAISSFVAGTLGLVGLTFFAPLLADVAVAFGPPEYFALMFMAMTLIISLSGRALLKGIISMALGLMTALIGQDPLTGAARLTFGFPKLLAGIDFISVIVGLFAISEVMINVEQRITAISQKIGSWMPVWADVK